MAPTSMATPERPPEAGLELAGAAGSGRRVLAALLLVTVLAGWLFGAALAGGRIFAERDLAAMDRPARSVLVRLWRSFPHVPEWNPYAASGQPLAANPRNAVFHPLTWLFLFLPFDTAFALQIIVPVLVSFAGMAVLLLTLGRSRAAALYGGLIWGFGGFLLSITNLLPVLLTLAPVPLVVALVVRVRRSGRIGDWLLLVPTFALSCTGGEPVSLLVEAGLIACAWLATGGRSQAAAVPPTPPKARLGRSLLPLAALLAGAAVAAPVLLPAARLQTKTDRAGGLPFERAATWSFPPLRLIELVLPRALGDVGSRDASRYWGSPLYPNREYPLVYSIYAGVFTPLLALLGLGATRRGWIWGAVALGGLGLAFGRNAPLFALVYAACPPLRALRYPEKWLAVTAFALVVLAAGGFEAILREGGHRRRAASAYLVGVAASAIVVAGAVAVLTAAHGTAWWGTWLVPARGAAAFAGIVPTAAGAQGALALAGIAALFALRRYGRTAGVVALLVVTAADLGLCGRPLLTSEDPAVLDRLPSFYAGLAALPAAPRLFHLAQRQDVDEHLKLALAPPPATGLWSIPTALERDLDLTRLRWSGRAAALVVAAAERDPRLLDPLLARRGVGVVLSLGPEATHRHPGEAAPLPHGQVLLHAIPGPRPEVSCVTRLARFGTDAEWLDAVSRLGAGSRDAALLDHSAAPEVPESPSPCDVSAVSVGPARLSSEIDAHGPRRSLLAVNRTWDEWWSARLDGTPIEILRADVNLMAVVIPPGRHSLTVVYRDRTLARSIRLSLATLALWLTAAIAAALKVRHRSGS